MSSTRDRILDAARQLLEKQGDAVPTMSAIARAAGISRQALYLHFADHAELLQALVAHIDDREQLQAGIAAVQAAGDAAGQVRAWARMQTWHNPKIAAIARALDSTRHADPSAAAAWRDRTSNRHARSPVHHPAAARAKDGSTRPGQPPRRQPCYRS